MSLSIKLCKLCKKEFKDYTGTKKFCSRDCLTKSFRIGHDPKPCLFCRKLMKVEDYKRPQFFRKAKFCSSSCSAKARLISNIDEYNKLMEPRTCEYCGKIFRFTDTDNKAKYEKFRLKKTCSRKCQYALISKKSALPLDEHITIFKGRQRVLERANYKCEGCGISEWRGKKIRIEVHHIDNNRKNNNMDNLLALCPNCHSQTPSYRKPKNRWVSIDCA